MTKNTKLVLALLGISLAIAIVPLFIATGAEFGGTDDAGSQAVSRLSGEEYEPWFTPVAEVFLGGEIPGELESLLFCVQTGIGVGILAFGFGYLVARKKYQNGGETK